MRGMERTEENTQEKKRVGYLESSVHFEKPCLDFYAVLEKVSGILSSYPGVTHAPLGAQGNFYGVKLRGLPGYGFPKEKNSGNPLYFREGQHVSFRGGFILTDAQNVTRSLAEEDEAALAWRVEMERIGVTVVEESMLMERKAAYFFDPVKRLDSSIPFWAISASCVVVDERKAAHGMAYGIGAHKKWGFGMLMLA